MTGNQLIIGALSDLAILGAVDTVSAEDSASALACLNEMGESLGLERLSLYSTVRTTKTLTALTASYTIGAGGSINMVRPTWIDRATLVIDTTATTPTEVPIAIFEPDEYAAWPIKSLTATQSQAIFYDHGFTSSGYGTIYPLPIPTVNTTQLVLYTPGGEVSTFADLVTDYAMPRGYKRALRKNLALELAPMFGAQPSPLLVKQADESKAVVKRANVKAILRWPDGGMAGGHYNPLTDAPNRGRW